MYDRLLIVNVCLHCAAANYVYLIVQKCRRNVSM